MVSHLATVRAGPASAGSIRRSDISRLAIAEIGTGSRASRNRKACDRLLRDLRIESTTPAQARNSTPTVRRLIETADEIMDAPVPTDRGRAFLARQLVQATLPQHGKHLAVRSTAGAGHLSVG